MSSKDIFYGSDIKTGLTRFFKIYRIRVLARIKRIRNRITSGSATAYLITAQTIDPRISRRSPGLHKTAHSSLFTSHFLLLLLLLSACNNGPEQAKPIQISGPTMGTTYTVTIVPPHPENDADLATEISGLLEHINAIMSTYIPDSELSRLNQSDATGWIPVSSELFDVITAATEISNKTDGAFDITIGAIVNLWGFGPEAIAPELPDKTTITSTMQTTGYQKIQLMPAPAAIKKHPDSYLDLSGIAKGYAVDRIARLLDESAIENYLVEIGGEIIARGINQRDDSWRVGIERPDTETRTVREIVALDNAAMATSGGYRNYIMHDGNRYSHTIDPETGWPVTHNLTSVSVLDDSAMVADALATALLVMGPVAGFDYAEKQNIPALFIMNNEGIFSDRYTTWFQPYLVQ